MDVSKILSESIFYERKEPLKPSFRNVTLVEQIDFSKRAQNCLDRAKIFTLGQLLDKSINSLYNIRCAGKKTVQEIVDKVHEMGFKFAEEDEL